MFFGLDMEKLLLIGLIAVLIVGPDRLPRYAEALARFTVRVRQWMDSARTRVKDEMGDEFQEIEWRKLDPRQYDPRRIIRDALLEDDTPAKAAPEVPITPTRAQQEARRAAEPGLTPYDSEAT